MLPYLLTHDGLKFLGVVAVGFHALGILSAIQAVFHARTSQGATAWVIFLVAFPYAALPLFWIFGRDKFQDYTVARQGEDGKLKPVRRVTSVFPTADPAHLTLEKLAAMPFNDGNSAKLLIDGDAVFAAIFAAIEGAKDYLLVQFFIVKNDEIGRAFKERLLAAAKRGVKIYFLYDEFGSRALPGAYISEIAAVADIRPFKTRKGAKNRFQINFRNHRKIVIADGTIALLGGLNVGDEYLGRDPKFGHWRDTHIELKGPTVTQVQLAFAEDWNWSAGVVPPLNWQGAKAAEPGVSALALPTGPADELETCALFFLEAILMAKKRLWITSPYFVPDLRIISALQLAAMRGVEIKILLPSKPDHLMVWLASFSFLKSTIPRGIGLFRYQDGFVHQKVLLVDDHLSAVGTANFDNRSFRLNFEICVIVSDEGFAKEVEKMLEIDFVRSVAVTESEYDDRPYYFKAAVRFAALLSPIL